MTVKIKLFHVIKCSKSLSKWESMYGSENNIIPIHLFVAAIYWIQGRN